MRPSPSSTPSPLTGQSPALFPVENSTFLLPSILYSKTNNTSSFPGYSPSFQFANPEPAVAGWRVPEGLDNGFVSPSAYSNPNIICHKSASNPLGAPIPVVAGQSLELQWTPWPESHHGPVIDYLASCAGDDCSTVDKTTLEFFKIGEGGLNIGSGVPGTWASDELIANNNTWSAKIPADIAPGNYVLRHEIIALHSSGERDGAQNYPQCINIVVSGGGSAEPAGVVGTKLYTPEDAGILVNIYQNLKEYVIPGPKLYVSGSPPTAPEEPEEEVPASSTAKPVPSTSAAAPVVSDAPAPTQAPDQNEIPSGPNPVITQSEDETTTVQIVITSSVVEEGPAPTPAPEVPDACEDSTVTITEKGPTITAAGPTVTVGGGNAQTVTVTAAAQTVTVTAKPNFKPMPSGATVDDLMRWVGSKIGGGRSRRHAREVVA